MAVADNIEVKNEATTHASPGISVIIFVYNTSLMYNDSLCIIMPCDT